MCGTKDAAFPAVQQIHAAMPGTKLVPLEGAGHISNVEQPQAFTKAVADFLKG
jgi:pimeloyl-ACP methyl ester carboxylesterase